jgi:radical SAM-linked protein
MEGPDDKGWGKFFVLEREKGSQRLRIIFGKDQGARFLSHLDLLATFEYAMRRAGLPIELSEGFNRRPRMSVAAPLALGHIGEAEILELTLCETLQTELVRQRLQESVPPGIAIHAVDEILERQKPAASRLRSASYRVELAVPVADLPKSVENALALSTIELEEIRGDRVRTRDIRPGILSLRAIGPNRLEMVLRLDSEGSVRPEQVLQALAISAEGARIIRERIELNA